MKLFLLFCFLTNTALAGYRVGDLVANHCWKDASDKSHCLDDDNGKVRILLYNATWCGPCKVELQQLVRRVLKKNVVYYSLVCDIGLNAGSLDRWDQSFGLTVHGIKTLASPRDCARDFEGNGTIPAVAVIGPDQKLKAFALSPGVNWILGW